MEFKPTEDEAKRIFNALSDKVVYDCINKLLLSLMEEEAATIVRLLLGDKPDDEATALIRHCRGKVKNLDKIRFYVNVWRKKALDMIKEEKDARGKKGKK